MYREPVESVFGRQHALITRTQALRAGLTGGQIRSRLESGVWEAPYRAVYRLGGAPPSDRQRVMAAVLAAGDGAMASHLSAAWLWDLSNALTLSVTVPLARNPRLAGVTVYRRDAPHPSLRHAIPVTNPLRTVLDLGSLGDGPVDAAIDRGLADRLFTVEGVAAELERLASRGRSGVQAVRAALDRRLDVDRPPSVLESRFGRLVRGAGLAQPLTEHEVLGGAYRLDFAWPEARVAVELDGYAHHSSVDAFRHDRQRQNDLVLAGWTLLRFTWDDVRSRPAGVAAAVRTALAASRSA
ncbi:MAG: DUF559 domain-containing protein [Acidimicrobiales bacterium]